MYLGRWYLLKNSLLTASFYNYPIFDIISVKWVLLNAWILTALG